MAWWYVDALYLQALFPSHQLGQREMLLRQLMDGTEAERPTAYAEASPVFHVHPDSPPFFLFHDSWDDLVEPKQAETFMQALEADGNHVELLWMNGRGHITTFLFRGSAESAALDFLAREMPAPDTSS